MTQDTLPPGCKAIGQFKSADQVFQETMAQMGQVYRPGACIADFMADPQMRGLVGDARAAMAQSGQPTGFARVAHPEVTRVDSEDDGEHDGGAA